VPVWTREKYNYYLAIHLGAERFSAIPINPPVVPRGTGRVRVIIHAGNTEKEVEALVHSICRWAKEMYDIERDPAEDKMPKAMQFVYGVMMKNNVTPTTSASAGNPMLE
jgi:8-amino-7-oxononanoate synthase